MVRVYGLAYYCDAYIKKSIESITSDLDEKVELIVVENKSKNSDTIRKDLQSLGDSGLIKKAYLMEGNSRGNALIDIVKLDPLTDSESFFMITDLDLKLPKGNIIADSRKYLNSGYGVTGLGLDLSNYVPPNTGHTDSLGFGWWMMGIDKNRFNLLPKDIAYTDSYLISNLLPAIKLSYRCYHYSWDVWKDYPEYWQIKQAGVDWSTYTNNTIEDVLEWM